MYQSTTAAQQHATLITTYTCTVQIHFLNATNVLIVNIVQNSVSIISV